MPRFTTASNFKLSEFERNQKINYITTEFLYCINHEQDVLWIAIVTSVSYGNILGVRYFAMENVVESLWIFHCLCIHIRLYYDDTSLHDTSVYLIQSVTS